MEVDSPSKLDPQNLILDPRSSKVWSLESSFEMFEADQEFFEAFRENIEVSFHVMQNQSKSKMFWRLSHKA